MHMWQGETILLVCTGEPYFVFQKNLMSCFPTSRFCLNLQICACKKTHTQTGYNCAMSFKKSLIPNTISLLNSTKWLSHRFELLYLLLWLHSVLEWFCILSLNLFVFPKCFVASCVSEPKTIFQHCGQYRFIIIIFFFGLNSFLMWSSVRLVYFAFTYGAYVSAIKQRCLVNLTPSIPATRRPSEHVALLVANGGSCRLVCFLLSILLLFTHSTWAPLTLIFPHGATPS